MEAKPISPNADLKDAKHIGLYESLVVDDCVGELPVTAWYTVDKVVKKHPNVIHATTAWKKGEIT